MQHHDWIHYDDVGSGTAEDPYLIYTAEQLDAFYGSAAWRDTLTPYMVTVGRVDTVQHTRVDEVHVRDAFGGLWRDDRRPWQRAVCDHGRRHDGQLHAGRRQRRSDGDVFSCWPDLRRLR